MHFIKLTKFSKYALQREKEKSNCFGLKGLWKAAASSVTISIDIIKRAMLIVLYHVT